MTDRNPATAPASGAKTKGRYAPQCRRASHRKSLTRSNLHSAAGQTVVSESRMPDGQSELLYELWGSRTVDVFFRRDHVHVEEQ